MEPQEHIATLCAVGTLGIAATGLALGTVGDECHSPRPGKRKWPGSNVTTSSPVAQVSDLSQSRISPLPMVDAADQDTQLPLPSSLFRKRTGRDGDRDKASSRSVVDRVSSRASSSSRSSMLRPWTSETRSSSENRDISTSSSWLKRLSNVSSLQESSPGSSILRSDSPKMYRTTNEAPTRPSTSYASIPNKLVKRSTSQRAVSSDQGRGIFLRRPATSYQRSQSYREVLPITSTSQGHLPDRQGLSRVQAQGQVTSPSPAVNSTQLWRPFLEGGYARKRRVSGVSTDEQSLRTISSPPGRWPTLVLGSAVKPSDCNGDRHEALPTQVAQAPVSNRRHKLRRSLNSIRSQARQRYFTDPTTQVTRTAAQGSIEPVVKQSSSSPVSTFNFPSLGESPNLNSSPPLTSDNHHSSSLAADVASPGHLTSSSDNDTHPSTDDDSFNSRSDTAYDSVTTRATVLSRSDARSAKLDTLFAQPHTGGVAGGVGLEKMMQRATLNDDSFNTPIVEQSEAEDQLDQASQHGNDHGFFAEEFEGHSALTPERSGSLGTEDMSATPMPSRISVTSADPRSSPPLIAIPKSGRLYETVGDMVDDMDLDDEGELDWPTETVDIVPFPRTFPGTNTYTTSKPTSTHVFSLRQLAASLPAGEETLSDKRSSIFDWSEQQSASNSPRPKTVHGKQSNDNRIRSSGRKAASQTHLRSQSVPANRDSYHDDQKAASKYRTWGLGHKPVSEEWSDDFEFDDVEDNADILAAGAGAGHSIGAKDSIRSVKVPQKIMDRQASVHLQFGQVQEFMLLVEELKRLRSRGAALSLLESQSKQLWEDADSIINLATINEEEDGSARPESPMSSDIFGDDAYTTPSKPPETGPFPSEDSKRRVVTRRSVSGAATVPHGRPRGESLAQAKSFLQTIHQSRSGFDSSPRETEVHQHRKLPFDTQDLRDLVVRSGVITRALKEVVRVAEGVSVSPNQTPLKQRDPAFSQIFRVPETIENSPCPPCRKPGLIKSKSENSYLENSNDATQAFSPPLALAAVV